MAMVIGHGHWPWILVLDIGPGYWPWILAIVTAITLSRDRTLFYAERMSVRSPALPRVCEHAVYTVGHSTHALSDFLALLARYEISAVADVRSNPYSRMNPQFNRDGLKAALSAAGIAYVFLGKELGARSRDPRCYEHGKVHYGRVAQTAAFQRGLARVQRGAKQFRLALMCAEKEPLDCHRTILVARHLDALGIDVQHIVAPSVEDTRLESHHDAIARLKQGLQLSEDLFASAEEVTALAYEIQGGRMAYELPSQSHVRKVSGEDGESGGLA
jgi:hypothetical protein